MILQMKLEDITTGEAEGRGFYDELMRTNASHLMREYDSQRLTGSDYAQAYIAMMQASMQAATNTILQFYTINKQLMILDEQLKQAELNTDLIAAQIRKINEEILVSEYQREQILPLQKQQLEKQITLLQSQNLGQIAQNTLLASQNSGQLEQNKNYEKQGALLDAQVKTEQTNTADATSGTAKYNQDKIKAETSVINQKLVTEKAQTEGSVGVTKGLIGNEMELKHAQAESFKRDAEQKAAKFYADVLSIVYASDPVGDYSNPNEWGLGGGNSQQVMAALLNGINVTPVP